MTTTYPPDVTDRFVKKFTRLVARELIAEDVYPESDLEDLVQELQLAVVERAPRFDAERAKWSTFVKTVVRRRAISLRRRQMAECRAGGREVSSLNVTFEDEDGQTTTLANLVREDQSFGYLGRDYQSDEDQAALAMDVATVISKLPTELRELCELLKHGSIADVARDRGIPRTTLRHQLNKIREAFVAAGFEPPRNTTDSGEGSQR
jgi:RNA polymerase sigma-70 factor (ECF subfamily)